jgi:hypothetical protein
MNGLVRVAQTLLRDDPHSIADEVAAIYLAKKARPSWAFFWRSRQLVGASFLVAFWFFEA